MEWIRSLDFFKNRSVTSIERMVSQGKFNALFRVVAAGKPYVVRQLLDDAPDREAEVTVHAWAYDQGIAPQLHDVDPERSVMILAVAKGEHRRELSRGDLALLATKLRRLHRMGDAHDRVPHIVLEERIVVDRPEIAEAFETISHFPHQTALCHNDLNPDNLLWHDDAVMLIDFEYAGYNDAFFDLAAVSVEFDLNDEMERYWVSSYWDDATWETEKLSAYKVLYRAICRQWFEQAQGETSSRLHDQTQEDAT